MVQGTVDSTVDNGQWIGLVDAARALGVSEKTARRRAKAGQLEARQVPTQRGPTWQVRLPNGVPSVDRVGSQGTQADRGATMLELVRLVGELQPKAEAAAMWQARAEMLADRLAVAASQLLAISAPISTLTASTAPKRAGSIWETFGSVRAWLLGLLAIAVVVVLVAWPR